MAGFVVHPGAVKPYEWLQRKSGSPGARHRETTRRSGEPRQAPEEQRAARFYERLARSAGRVLEYGAGRGDLSWAMAAAGARVVAVDLSEELLAELGARGRNLPREVARRVTLRRADMRSLRLRQRFPLAVAPRNTFAHLYNRADLEAFLEGVRRHLVPGGRFVFDLGLPRPADLLGEYDPLAQILIRELEPGVVLAERQFQPRELEMLLHYNGFSRVHLRGDFGSKRPCSSTSTLVVTARTPSAQAVSLGLVDGRMRRGVRC